MEREFPFADYTDDELEYSIDYAFKEIIFQVNSRDFEGIENWGMTLNKLELEQRIRKQGAH